MRIILIGLNHRTAPIDVREPLAVEGDAVKAALNAWRQAHPHCEAVLLSTCNRTELYIARPAQQPLTADDLRRFLAHLGSTSVKVVTAASIHREQDEAVHHLFRVSTGLDSMVLGEPQILGQVRRAYETAVACGTVGPTLHSVFQQAMATAKRVRTETGIDAGRISVASVAVDFAHRMFDDFSDKTIVGVGAGNMAGATLRHLQQLSPMRLWLAARSVERGMALAQSLELAPPQGGVRPWEDLDALLVEADIIISSTSAREPVITTRQIEPLLRRRRNRPLFIIDIAVPRDVEPTVGSLRNVYLYNIDDLQSVVSANYQQRREQADRCEADLAEAATRCVRQIQNQNLGQLIRQLRRQLHDIGEVEQQRTRRKLAALSSADADAAAQVLDEHTRRVINKILHLPLSQLDHRNPDAPLGFYSAALRRLFRLSEGAGPNE